MIVRSVRKIWVMFINTRSGLDAPRTCWEKSLASYLILSMESFEVTRTTFEKPRVTAVVIEFLPSNLKNLRCNLRLFSVQCYHCRTLIEVQVSANLNCRDWNLARGPAISPTPGYLALLKNWETKNVAYKQF